ncbi:MAG: J domain-containing protein [Cryomorphaceae bacterium]|nr:J domain-containing protein [Cryomorphaceae bacterium]
MKRINAYKKLFQIDNQIELAALKQTYRALVKQWHPDKFQDGDPLKEQAEEMGRQVVDGYHFLVSIAPYKKLINADKQVRFAKRFVYESFLYRQSKKATTVEA